MDRARDYPRYLGAERGVTGLDRTAGAPAGIGRSCKSLRAAVGSAGVAGEGAGGPSERRRFGVCLLVLRGVHRSILRQLADEKRQSSGLSHKRAATGLFSM